MQSQAHISRSLSLPPNPPKTRHRALRYHNPVAGIIMKLFAAILILSAWASAQIKEIPRAALRDKIEGGWAGQMIGVSFGAPTEFRSNAKIITGELPKWKPERVSNSLDQDDLYVDMTFAKVLDDKGINATTADFGAMFKNAKYRAVARQPGRPACAQARRPGRSSGHAEVQRSRQRYRFPDRSRFHRSDGARAAAIRQRHRLARRARDELGRRHLRRHVHVRHVRRRVL